MDPIEQQKNYLDIKLADYRTYVVVVAVHREMSRNTINSISCINGIPITGYVYDIKAKTYQVECADYLYLGFVPIGFVASGMHWKIKIPVHESILKQFMTDQQLRELKLFTSHFKPENYTIEYIQMVDCNF